MTIPCVVQEMENKGGWTLCVHWWHRSDFECESLQFLSFLRLLYSFYFLELMM